MHGDDSGNFKEAGETLGKEKENLDMSRVELLKDYIDMAEYKLYVYSESMVSDKPKKGYEKPWHDTKEELSILDDWIAELGGIDEIIY